MAGIHNALVGATTKRALNLVISSDLTNVDLRALLIGAGWNSQQLLDATVTIASGVVISASHIGVYALDTGTTPFPIGSKIRLNNQGYIVGRGGDANGGNGGPALRAVGGLNLAFSVDNTGTIAGGGGAGGYGQTLTIRVVHDGGKSMHDITASGGIGGGGRTGRTNSYPNGSFAAPGPGSSGTHQPGPISGSYVTGGPGGSGGHWGSNGNSGGGASYSGGTVQSSSGPSGGGGAGIAVAGNGNISWINTGTRLGAIT